MQTLPEIEVANSGLAPSAVYERAVSEAIKNTLFYGGVLVAAVWFAPRWLAKIVGILVAVLEVLDLISVAAVVITTPVVVMQQPLWRDRLFLLLATAARVGGAVVMIWLLFWAWRQTWPAAS